MFLLALALSTPPEPRPLAESIEVQSTDTCLTAENLAHSAETWLGRDGVTSSLTLRVRHEATGVTVDVVQAEGVSRRTLDAPPSECDALVAAVGLTIAFVVDGPAVHGASTAAQEPGERPSTGADGARDSSADRPPSSAPATEPEASSRVQQPDDTDRADERPHTDPDDDEASRGDSTRRGRLRGRLGVGPAVGYGVLPRFSFGVGAAAFANWRPFSVGVASEYQESEPLSLGRGTLRARMVTVAALGCWFDRRRKVAFSICAGPLGGLGFGRGRGYARNHRTTVHYVAAVVEPEVRVSLVPKLWMGMALRGSVPVVRARFDSVDGTQRTSMSSTAIGAIGFVRLYVLRESS